MERQDKQWNAIFPAEQRTEKECATFLSRMSYIAFAEYLLNREIVSPKVFTRRRIGDTPFHTFNKQFRWGQKLSDMMRGIGEAIELKYARQAFIMINEDEEDRDLATEVFTISFAYDQEDCLQITDENGNSVVSMGHKGKDALRQQVAYLISRITSVSTKLKRFDNSVTPFIKLTYYDNRTPADYQPFAFQHCDTTYIFKSVPPKMEFGAISTNFVAAAIDIQSVYIDDLGALEEAVALGLDYRVDGFMDVTVDGDITINDMNDDVHELQRSDSLEEVARQGQEILERDLERLHEERRSLLNDALGDAVALQDESFNSSEPSPDTTNEDEYAPTYGKRSASSVTGGRGKRTTAKKKSPVKKASMKKKAAAEKRPTLRSTRRNKAIEEAEDAPDAQEEERRLDEESGDFGAGSDGNESRDVLPPPWKGAAKVSKAHTSPNRHNLSPNRQLPIIGRFAKSSVVLRSVDKSPSDNEC